MKDLTNAIAALALASLWYVAGACTPEPTAVSPAIEPAAAPIPANVAQSVEPLICNQQVVDSTSTVASTPEIPPDAGTEPDAATVDSPSAVAVETYAMPSVVPVAESESPAASVAPHTQPTYRQPVYQPVYRRRGILGRFRR